MNKVRIIGGAWRRRLLNFPDHEGLRPTSDRVRETLFNWLGQDLHGQTCLDLFAGSGALGFEAASRGAASVVMVEKSAKVCAALEDNARLLKADAALEIRRQDAVEFALLLCATDRRFDILFIDPPYNKGWVERLLPILPNLLREDGLIYLEAETRFVATPDWSVVHEGRAGQSFYHLLRYTPTTAAITPITHGT